MVKFKGVDILDEKKEYRIIVCGSRKFTDYKIVEAELDKVISKIDTDKFNITIVSGGAKGADILGEYYADNKGFNMVQFKPKWDMFRNYAGFIRNSKMLAYIQRVENHCVVAFWDGESNGTKHTIHIAEDANVEVIKIIK